MSFMRRLIIQYDDLRKNPPSLCYAEPKNPDEDMTNWIGYIDGPEGTPYANGRFYLDINFPPEYPFKPPQMCFTTPVYHPNISTKGEICLDLLHSQWSPILGIRHLLLSLCSLLGDPNVEHGLNSDALACFKTNPTGYEKIVREWTTLHANKT